MRSLLRLSELTVDQFLASLDPLTKIYAAAMNAPAFQLPGRQSIMERHANNPGFTAIAALLSSPAGGLAADGQSATGGIPAGDGVPGGRGTPAADSARDGGQDPVPARTAGGTSAGPAEEPAEGIAGFAYGFHGQHGQWWHDLVRGGLARQDGTGWADQWLADAFEVAEVHVHPGHQGQGTGRAMLLRLTDRRPERTAVLSTMDADTRARRLYRGLGFTDLLRGFAFPGASEPYAIMGAPLPLARPCLSRAWPAPRGRAAGKSRVSRASR